MFDVEDNENIRKSNFKKKKRKHSPFLESNLMHRENKELKLIDDGESNKKKHNEPRDTEKSYERVSTNFNEDINGELYSRSNNPQKKEKKQKEKTNQSLDIITEPFIESEVSHGHESGISVKKCKYNKSDVNEEYSNTIDKLRLNIEQNAPYLYKKKKKKVNYALDESIAGHIESEVDDHVKKSKKKKHKAVALAQEEEAASIPQEKVKKRKYPVRETEGTHLPSITEPFIKSEVSHGHESGKSAKKCKYNKSDNEEYSNTVDEHHLNIEQNAHYSYKKKKKKKEKVNCALDESITDHTESEVYDDHVKKSKKKKHKDVALAQEAEEASIPQEKVKKRKYLARETVGTHLPSITEPFTKSEVSDGHEPGISVKKCKYNKSDVNEEYSNTIDEHSLNIEQNAHYLYKKKKKKKEKVNCALDESIADQFESETYDDHVKKSKKKKRKEVALAQEEEVASIPQEKVKKRKYPVRETVGTHLPSRDFLESSDIPLKKSKKHKHKDKISEFSTSDSLPIKLKKMKHEKNVAVPEDTQSSLFVDGSSSEILKTANSSMERSLCDTNDSVLGNLTDRSTPVSSSQLSIKQSIDSSPEGNTSKYIHQSRDDTAMSESVSDDTFTLEVHEVDSHNSLDDRIVSSNVAEVKSHPKKQYYIDDSGEDLLDATINHSNENRNCVKSGVNVQQKVKDISVKTAPLKKGHLSYQQLCKQVEDKSQPKENCNFTTMHITVPWPVPPLHLIETRVCGRPTNEQRTKMKASGENMKSGIYNRSEDDQIKKNWREFCQIHDLQNEDPTPFLNFTQADGSLILSTAERINFVRFLAHGLHNRPLYSVYKRFQRLFLANKIVTGRFSPEEDEIIRKYMKRTSRRTPYSDLAKILNRDRLAVEKRCKSLECIDGNGDKSMKWEKENIEEFLKHILKITESDSLNDLKDREIKPQEWKALSEKLGISTTKLRRAWSYTIYPKLFISNNGVSTDVIKVALIKKLIENNENDWRVVNWEQMAKDFDGFTGLKLNKFMKDVVHYHVPQDMHNNLGECLQYLKKLVSQKKNFLKRSITKIKINESLLIT